MKTITKIERGFRWDGTHHIPQLVVEFTPVPGNGPTDAKGWRDRNDLADHLAAAPQPEGREQPEPGAVLRQISDHLSSMMASRTEIVDGICDVTGYQIKTGALHQIIGLLQAFKPVIISRTNRVMTQLPDAAHQPPPAQAEGQRGCLSNCGTCRHKQNPDGGWCYMFRDEPQGECKKWVARAGKTAQAEGQEAVAWIEHAFGALSYAVYHNAARRLPDNVRFDLYTHPPRREWVKSTLEEKVILLLQHGCGERIPLLEEFEELLKGKNHG